MCDNAREMVDKLVGDVSMASFQTASPATPVKTTYLTADCLRKSYKSPELSRFGSMATLTLAGAGSVSEVDSATGRNKGNCATNNMMATNVMQYFCS